MCSAAPLRSVVTPKHLVVPAFVLKQNKLLSDSLGRRSAFRDGLQLSLSKTTPFALFSGQRDGAEAEVRRL